MPSSRGQLFERLAARAVADDRETCALAICCDDAARHFQKQLVILFGPQRGDDRRRPGRSGRCPARGGRLAASGTGAKRVGVDAVGNHERLCRPASCSSSIRNAPCESATAMKASVIGVSRRLSRPTPSGQPVLCSAERTTGTPTRRAASRPQNILSPAPTVTTASICRSRKQPRQPRPDAQVVLAARASRGGPESRRPASRRAGRAPSSSRARARTGGGRAGGRAPRAASPRRRPACS